MIFGVDDYLSELRLKSWVFVMVGWCVVMATRFINAKIID